MLTKSHATAKAVLEKLREREQPVPYLVYARTMARYGYDADLARRAFNELDGEIRADLTIEF
ncbi:hypothetical protein TZ00_08740 [Agreia bicolorata]|uniref:Uncharacterized protein n=1 Tax=Agreia bicolorata TaxID=110935 RepID=A0ABR5CFU0_9MICO|nr:hypothetical protein TZ00_08740 [Agreia bicolorata]